MTGPALVHPLATPDPAGRRAWARMQRVAAAHDIHLVHLRHQRRAHAARARGLAQGGR